MENKTYLRDWFVASSEQDGYKAPELTTPRLMGLVFNHPDPNRHEDGKLISPSRPVAFDPEQCCFLSRSGTVYYLEDPNPSYKQMIPDAREILIRKFSELPTIDAYRKMDVFQ